jgi:hypothetical protein
MLLPVEQEADGVEWERRADIEHKPSRQVPASGGGGPGRRVSCPLLPTNCANTNVGEALALPDCYFLGVVHKDVRLAVNVRDEESEHDVNREEPVHDVVHDERGPWQVPQERELQWAYPGRVHHQEDQKRLPDPASQHSTVKPAGSA